MTRSQRWYMENKELTIERANRWKAENPEARRAATRRYRAKNRELLNKKSRDRYRKDPNINRRSSYRLRYGITIEQYEAMLEAQEGKCFLCGDTPLRRLHIDHAHSTGTIRKLLCNECNVGLGKFRESPKVLRAAAAYVEAFP